jgi:glycosyltransferase involved in cell wall biosynthesis
LLLSVDFKKWVNEFSPDLIYSQLSSLELIQFVSSLKEYLKKPIVIHLMEDWPSTISNKQIGFFRLFWRNFIDKELRKIFNESDVLLSISEAMSEEYLMRYGKIFLPFHNPINVKDWTASIKKDYSRKDTFIVLYAGRIGTGLQNCLLSFAYAVKNQVNKGRKIEFHIQSGSDHPVLKELDKIECVKFRNQVPYEQLPNVFSSSDLLLLPNDFDEKFKYSMPTKASEYMVSGTPILVFSSSETAVTKHTLKYGWAYVVSENSIEKLEKAINELYEDEELRKETGCRAKEFAIKNYESEQIRENFKNSIKKES